MSDNTFSSGQRTVGNSGTYSTFAPNNVSNNNSRGRRLNGTDFYYTAPDEIAEDDTVRLLVNDFPTAASPSNPTTTNYAANMMGTTGPAGVSNNDYYNGYDHYHDGLSYYYYRCEWFLNVLLTTLIVVFCIMLAYKAFEYVFDSDDESTSYVSFSYWFPQTK
jgi:hypothetical protein